MSRSSKSGARGFTLVEVLVAGVILALSAVVLGTTVSHCMRSLTLARDYQRAAELLDKTLTKVDLIGPERLLYEGPREGVFDEPHQRFAWQVGLSSRTQGHLYEVTVRILWKTAAGTTRFVEAQTLLNDPPELQHTPLAWEEL